MGVVAAVAAVAAVGVAAAVFELAAFPIMIHQLPYWHVTLSHLVLDISPNFVGAGIVRHLAG